jgi:hypothetical protein
LDIRPADAGGNSIPYCEAYGQKGEQQHENRIEVQEGKHCQEQARYKGGKACQSSETHQSSEACKGSDTKSCEVKLNACGGLSQ